MISIYPILCPIVKFKSPFLMGIMPNTAIPFLGRLSSCLIFQVPMDMILNRIEFKGEGACRAGAK